MAGTLGGVHQNGIAGLEEYRPIGLIKKDKSASGSEAQTPKEPAHSQSKDRVELSKESSQEPQRESSGGGFLENLMKTLNPFD